MHCLLLEKLFWTPVEDVAKLLNTTTDDEFTPETFKDIYLSAWIKEHVKEAAENNPNPEAELAIIEQVKNETASGTGETDEPTTTPNNSGNTEVDASDGAAGDGAAEDKDETSSTGTGRQLTSATMRLASAALRMFGI